MLLTDPLFDLDNQLTPVVPRPGRKIGRIIKWVAGCHQLLICRGLGGDRSEVSCGKDLTWNGIALFGENQAASLNRGRKRSWSKLLGSAVLLLGTGRGRRGPLSCWSGRLIDCRSFLRCWHCCRQKRSEISSGKNHRKLQ